MSPRRKEMIGWNKVEEYYWGGNIAVFINNKKTLETFEQAVARLEDKNETL